MTKKELQKILDDHRKWINNENGGARADLRNADLRWANLCDAYLCNANLCNADLRNADLCNANLCNANLCNADLRNADLRGADLRGADLSNADLRGADLRNANLCGADLSNADLRGADLSNADLRYADLDIKVFCLDRIGSRKGRTTYDATNDVVWCGCFKGTFAEWCDKIKKTYPDKKSQYRCEYEAAIVYFKTLANNYACGKRGAK